MGWEKAICVQDAVEQTGLRYGERGGPVAF